MDIILTKDQLKTISENQNLNEAWYNTVLELVGWADPTGIADAINGFIYIKRGDYLFGVLSLISAVPYVGDAIAKPVLAALKIGKPSAKVIEKSIKLINKGDVASATKLLQDASKTSPLVEKFVSVVGKNSDKVKELVNALPSKYTKGLKSTVIEWFDFFGGIYKQGKLSRSVIGNLAKRIPKKSTEKQLEDLRKIHSLLKKGPFSSYTTPSKGAFSWKSFWGGMPRILGSNKSMRSLIRRTKWYAGLLDYLGVYNFVGPDELMNDLGKDKFEEKVEEYNTTEQAQEYIREDFGNESYTYEEPTGSTSTTTATDFKEKMKKDAFDYLLRQILPI